MGPRVAARGAVGSARHQANSFPGDLAQTPVAQSTQAVRRAASRARLASLAMSEASAAQASISSTLAVPLEIFRSLSCQTGSACLGGSETIARVMYSAAVRLCPDLAAARSLYLAARTRQALALPCSSPQSALVKRGHGSRRRTLGA